MNDSPVVSAPDTHSAVCARHLALLRWRAHGAETAAVALGTAAVAMQWARHGPVRWLTDDAGVALATTRAGGTLTQSAAPAGSPAWRELLTLGHRLGLTEVGGWYAGALALLCLAGALYAAVGTVRALRGRRAWPFALGAAGVLAVSPPALGWLFSGTGEALALLVLALAVRVIAGAAVRGRLACARTAAGAALLAVLGALASPAGLALGAVYPAALLFSGRRHGCVAAALRGGAVHVAVWATACVGAWPADGWFAAPWGVGVAGAVALGACAAGRAAVPLRLAAGVVGVVLLLVPDAGLPAGVALAVCGALLSAGRGATGRIAGATALGGAVAVLWAGALGAVGGAVLVGCALVAAAACRLPAPVRPPGLRPHLRPRSVVVGAVVAGTLVAGWGAATPAPPAGTADTLCFTEARYGHMFAAYARRLGLRRSTVALASPGGTLALGEQQALDLRGRTDGHVAAARAADDDAALRRYLFVRARPEFVHVEPDEAARTGLTAERLAAHGYRPLLRQGSGGDFVHRSAVTVPERLPELRAWARDEAAGLAGCAPVR